MKTAKRILSILAVVIMLVSCFNVFASAKNVCNEIRGTTNRDGAKSTVFYVTAKNKNKNSVKMTMTKGTLSTPDCLFVTQEKKIYDFYEVIVYGKKSNGSYVQISKNNVKNKSSYSINFSGYKEYKIKIYSWKTSTIASYNGYFKDIFNRVIDSNPYWKIMPTWYISRTSGITLCK